MAIVKWFKYKNPTPERLVKAVQYIQNPAKSSPDVQKGFYVGLENPWSDMKAVLDAHQIKQTRSFRHYVVSFGVRDLTSEVAFKAGCEVGAYYGRNFPTLMCLHQNAPTRLHCHYLLSTTDIKSGRKFRQSDEEMRDFLCFVNEVLDKYSLPRIGQKEYLYYNESGDYGMINRKVQLVYAQPNMEGDNGSLYSNAYQEERYADGNKGIEHQEELLSGDTLATRLGLTFGANTMMPNAVAGDAVLYEQTDNLRPLIHKGANAVMPMKPIIYSPHIPMNQVDIMPNTVAGDAVSYEQTDNLRPLIHKVDLSRKVGTRINVRAVNQQAPYIPLKVLPGKFLVVYQRNSFGIFNNQIDLDNVLLYIQNSRRDYFESRIEAEMYVMSCYKSIGGNANEVLPDRIELNWLYNKKNNYKYKCRRFA